MIRVKKSFIVSEKKIIAVSLLILTTVLLWNRPKGVVGNISENSVAVFEIIGCNILLDLYMEDSHSLNVISQAAGSSRVHHQIFS